MIALRRPIRLAAALVVSIAAGGAAHGESPSSPVAEALRVEVAIANEPSDAARIFYAERGNQPFWLGADGSPTPQARTLLAWAGQAGANVLPAARYRVASLAAELAQGGRMAASRTAGTEMALTRLFLAYARDLSSGVVDPLQVSDEIDVQPEHPSPLALLHGMASAADPAGFLQGLRPSDPAYDRLVVLYARMRAIEAAGGWGPPVEAGPALREGDRDPRVAQMRARLVALGDLDPTQPAAPESEKVATNEVATDAGPASMAVAGARPRDPMLFDAALDQALRRFQARHGLNTDGVAGSATIAALNTSAAERAAQIAVNLERLRWFDIRRDGRVVYINIADFRMKLLEDGATRFQTRTVVGQSPKHRTPEFNDQLEYIVVNPIWNVPYSIASKEILPLLRKNPAYLEENNMELLGASLPASEIDWSTVTQRSFPGRLRQLPGPDNALGFVKFLFPNSHSIYMHDTPSRKLFARDRRDFSHGCVRLEKPYDFAHLLLSLQPAIEDPVGKFDELRGKEGEQWVGLADPIPVYLTYRTAWVDDDGTIQFRADVYGRDRAVAAALTAAGVTVGG